MVRILIVLNIVGGIGAGVMLLDDKQKYPNTAEDCKYCSNQQEQDKVWVRLIG